MRLRVRVEKKPSTALSQDAEDQQHRAATVGRGSDLAVERLARFDVMIVLAIP
jgi:hypothetical protein